MKQNIDFAAYEKNLNQDLNLPSKKKKIDHNDSFDYCPTSIKEVINWLYFLDIMEYTAYSTDNEITLLPSLLKMFSMFQIHRWYNKGSDDKNKVEIYL